MKIEENCYYHIYNRGNNKNEIFFEDQNYRFFLSQFAKYIYPCAEVYAYVLMPNHFHFFLKVTNQVDFEKGIKNFFISYSKVINLKYERVGSLFQGRYKSKKIDSESYYTRIITYIHQNPVQDNLVAYMGQYKYSSYQAYLSRSRTLIKKDEVLGWFGGIEGFITDHQLARSD
ncbi:transposase [Pedobacter paludis]|uniref:Transposase n=1 Tax=Pedobacter paludis TaxID=2203212 RepID=A0A317F447_9SPHI|nr:transposase [Pedobacter paludis]PWS32807.1 transposase [Pedobacter paludis]